VPTLITGLLQKYNALNQVHGETKALWESQTMKLHEETARSQLMSESESSVKDALDRQMTAVSAQSEDLLVKLHAAEERAAAAEAAMREARNLMTVDISHRHFASQTTVQLMTAGVLNVTNLTPRD
jgi:hypothetical protein